MEKDLLNKEIGNVNYEVHKSKSSQPGQFIYLPFILCGPILRRIEPKKVCIWFATSINPLSAKAEVKPLEAAADGKGQNMWLPSSADVAVSTVYNCHRLGKNLFAILLEITPPGKSLFSTDKLYGYDIIFRFSKTQSIIINNQEFPGAKYPEISFVKFYNKKNEYSYASLPYPVFVIPGNAQQNSRILYGSCRKTHGPGSDALNAADTFLENRWKEYYKNLKIKIPNYSLFHLGDQIYADDLHEEVFKTVKTLSKAIMGYEETIPAYQDNKHITGLAFSDKHQLDTRGLGDFLQEYLKNNKKYKLEDLNFLTHINYSSTNKKENVVTFLKKYYSTVQRTQQGDVDKVIKHFLATDKLGVHGLIGVLEKFSRPESTKIDLNEILPRRYMIDDKLATYSKKIDEIPYKKEKEKNGRKEFLRTHSSITTTDNGHCLSFGEYAALYLINWGTFGFKGSIGTEHTDNKKIKRLFANVPSYMIFDDHDVTDEWNCDEVWRNRIKNSVTGKRLVANALAAYWAFQGWGNDPDSFANGELAKPITKYLNHLVENNGSENLIIAGDYEDKLWDYSDWAFAAPTNPISVFMDNRTMRYKDEAMTYFTESNFNKKYKGARQMSPKAYIKLEKLLENAGYKKDSPIIFCAPTPVLGSKLAHKLQNEMIDGSFNKNYKLVIESKFKKPGRYEWDWEMWWSNPRSIYDFLNFIDGKIKPTNVYILSGDVHYGFHNSGTFQNVKTKRLYSVDQFTSSAFKNNTLERSNDINWFGRITLVDTKEYGSWERTFPSPKPDLPSSFTLTSKIQKYKNKNEDFIDEDTSLIAFNNIGLLVFFKGHGKLQFSNYFLHVKYAGAPLSVSKHV